MVLNKKIVENVSFEPLTTQNVKDVHELCEANTLFVSQPLSIFVRVSLGSKIFDPELSLVARDGEGRAIGFFMFVLRRSNLLRKKRKVAVVKFMVIEESWRYQGLGSKMFNMLLSRIKESEKKSAHMKLIAMTSQPDYWFPGLDPRHTEAYFFLLKHGLKKKGERVNLCVQLGEKYKEKPSPEKGNYIISRATPEDKKELVDMKFMSKAYRMGFWPEEVELTYQNEPITTFIAKDKSNGEIVGWASHSAMFPGSFGPTGVNKNVRGQGLGGLLLEWCLWDIKQLEEDKATIMWVVGETIKFYLKTVGARICEIFWNMGTRI